MTLEASSDTMYCTRCSVKALGTVGLQGWRSPRDHEERSPSLYGNLTDVSLEDERRVFDTNYWDVVHGCRTAVTRMRFNGGVIITS